MQNASSVISNGNRVDSRGWSEQFGEWPVDAPSQLYCTDCIAVYCSLEALKNCVVDANEPIPEELNNSHDGMNIPLSDALLLDLLDALVSDLGKVAAAEALGVNYRTLVACHESRRVSRRMRRALEEYRDTADGDAGDIADEVGSLERRVVALEKENRALREAIEAQAEQSAQLERQIGAQEEEERQRDGNDAFGVGDSCQQQWWPRQRGHGLPDAGVITLEEQPDEEHAFGPAASLVAEWRSLRTGGEASGSRIDRARASVRRWELEVAMLGDFRLTLPPAMEPLDASRREDHLRWRREALAAARRELAKAKRLHWLRRVLTLWIWRR